MKLEKGYTLSQFIDYVSKDRPYATTEPMSEEADNYVSIYDYNNFLKQELKKEMFINEIEYPDELYLRRMHGQFWNDYQQETIDEWQEAEKKVIFKGVWVKSRGMKLFDVKINKQTIVSYNEKDFFNSRYKTLGDLFQTIPDLQLQNISL